MTMVEKVAQAIFDEEYRDHRRPRPDVVTPWRLYERQARAAIEAMREPSDEMKTACMAPCVGSTSQSYVAMIDAALGIPNPRNVGW